MPAYVTFGAEHRLAVTSGGVSGLTLPMPAAPVIGNFLLAVIMARPSGTDPDAGFSNDAIHVTAANAVWPLLADAHLGEGLGGHISLYGKHVTGGEGDLSALFVAVSTGGNGQAYGVVHEFSGVRKTDGTAYFESLHVTGRGSLSGPIFDADVVAVAGGNRLLVNIIGCVNGGALASEAPTGESVGKWTRAYKSTGSNNPRVAMWLSNDQSVGGGLATGGPAGNSPFTAMGFALAPCTIGPRPNRMHHYVMMGQP